ncbi:MAG: hypothetical protein JO055_00905 [Alphaproteobacteria bacterium]|nr:hypothetical protein [Alphaproteobacteria bacterium]
MRALRILPLLLVAMIHQAAAQSATEATATTTLPVARTDDRVATRPADSPPCTPWLDRCIRDDNSRMLLLLSVIGNGKRPLVLR